MRVFRIGAAVVNRRLDGRHVFGLLQQDTELLIDADASEKRTLIE